MEFGILGPLEVVREGVPLTLGGAKQRALLAILLLDVGRVVSVDRLVDELWGDDPPEGARHALRVHVSQLRKALGDGAVLGQRILATRSPGYVLQIDPEHVDAQRFGRLAAEGHQALSEGLFARASALLTQALQVWRGSPLADLAPSPFVSREAPRLEELRLAALEARIDADLALGRHESLVGELRGLVAEQPFRERIRGQLMLALYRSGRQTDALSAYRDGQALLAEEIGVDPSPDLQRLAQAILHQDREIDLLPPEGPVDAVATGGPTRGSLAPHDVRKLVTVLRAGVEVSRTDERSLDPEWLRGVMTRLADRLKEGVAHHGGLVERATPDEIVAVFGVPRVHEDDAERGLRAAFEMRAAAEGFLPEVADRGGAIAVAIGVDTGEVVSGAAEEDGLTVTGDVFAAAARLSRLAEPGRIVLGGRTEQLARGAVTSEAMDPSTLPEGLGRCFALESIDPEEPPPASRLGSPLIGRQAELERLERTFARAVRGGACELVSVLGAAGVGKTRLVEELVAMLGTGATALVGRCLAYGDGVTFRPVTQIVHQAAGIGARDTAEEARGKIRAICGGQEDGEVVAERLAQTIGLSEASPSPGETLWSARRFFETMARRRPLLVVVEDLHRAEPTLLDLIEHVAERSRDAPILLLCTARPEILDRRPGWGGSNVPIVLAPLPESEAAVLLQNLLGGADAEDAVARRVLDAAEGNPLFIEQILSMLIDEGLLRRGDGSWTLDRDLPDIMLPTRIQAVLAARLDRLDDAERNLLGCAAVIGREFGRVDVEQLLPEVARARVGDRLLNLVRRDLVRLEGVGPSGDVYRFAHGLVLEEAYASMPKLVRADLHERFARWTEATAEDRIGEVEEIVGHHFAQAYRYRSELEPVDERQRELASCAGRHLASAGRRAFARGDMPAAISLLSNAVSLLPVDDGLRLRSLPELGAALVEVGEMERASRTLNEAVELADACGNLAVKARALFYRCELYGWTAVEDHDEARVEAERMIPSLEALGDHGGLSYCWRIIAPTVGIDRWAEVLERARERARLAGDRLGQLEILQYLAAAALYDDTPADVALRRCDELIGMADGDRLTEAAVLINGRGPLLAMTGRFDEARRDVAEARAIFRDLDLDLWLAAAGTIFLVDVELLAGDPVAAERVLRSARGTLERMKVPSLISAEAALLARALYEQGRYAEAEEEEEVARLAEETEPDYYTGRGTRARLLARAGEMQEAERVAREGVAVAARHSSRVRADELMALADVLRMSGRPTDAAAPAEEALGLYEPKGNVVLAERARAFLARLRT